MHDRDSGVTNPCIFRTRRSERLLVRPTEAATQRRRSADAHTGSRNRGGGVEREEGDKKQTDPGPCMYMYSEYCIDVHVRRNAAYFSEHVFLSQYMYVYVVYVYMYMSYVVRRTLIYPFV